jgi:ornithine cyclodeaminase
MTLYLNESNLVELAPSYHDTVQVIEDAVKCLGEADYVQPLKPYLRFKDLTNRIIAMPAYIGEPFSMAGIKWIASFPNNINNGIPRAHSVLILNDSDTGQPISIINTPLLSIIRTASVSGLVIKHYLKNRAGKKLKVGIIGWGPIGRAHSKMCKEILGDQLEELLIYDIKEPDPVSVASNGVPVRLAKNWEEIYQQADIFITCTVSNNTYIEGKPKPGSLHLNVSLRDYNSDVYPYFKQAIIVDDWTEVCRENTDIERMYLNEGLKESDTYSLSELITKEPLNGLDAELPIMFNPMGMASFDIAIGTFLYKESLEQSIGLQLN